MDCPGYTDSGAGRDRAGIMKTKEVMETDAFGWVVKRRIKDGKRLAFILLILIGFGFAANVTCGDTLSTPNTYNVMNASCSIDWATAFTIAAQNVTLDCKGFSMTGNNASSPNGIYSNEFNTTIENCDIVDFKTAIYLDATSSNSITFCNITGAQFPISGAANNNTLISNNRLIGTPGLSINVGIELDDNIGNAQIRNNVFSTTQSAIFGYGKSSTGIRSESDLIQNNTITNSSICNSALDWERASNTIAANNSFAADSNVCDMLMFNITNGVYSNNTVNGSLSVWGGSVNATASSNTIFGNIYLPAGTNSNTFLSNIIQSDIWVDNSGTNNIFTCNHYKFANGNEATATYPVYDSTGDQCADFGNNLPYYYWTMPSNWIGLGFDMSPYTNLTSAQTGTLVQILVVDNAFNPVPNTSVRIVQINAVNNTNTTLGLFVVDEFGTTTTSLLPLTMLYAFSVYNQNGSTLIQAFPQTGLSCTTSNILCKHTLVLNINSVLPFYIRNNLIGSCTYDNTTLTINCQSTDPTSTLNNYSLQAFAQGNTTQACYNSSAGSSANLNCTLPAACGYYNYVFLGSDGIFSYTLSADTITENGCASTSTLGRSGWVAMLIIFGTIALIGSYSLPVAMMFGVMSLFFGMLVQLIPWTAGTPLIIFLVVALIIAYRSKV